MIGVLGVIDGHLGDMVRHEVRSRFLHLTMQAAFHSVYFKFSPSVSSFSAHWNPLKSIRKHRSMGPTPVGTAWALIVWQTHQVILMFSQSRKPLLLQNVINSKRKSIGLNVKAGQTATLSLNRFVTWTEFFISELQVLYLSINSGLIRPTMQDYRKG